MPAIKKNDRIELIAEHEGKIVGRCVVKRGDVEPKKHTAEYGIQWDEFPDS